MPASRMAARTLSATFSTIAGRPMSSGKISALIAVPMTSRDLLAGPVLALRAKTVACGVITPSQPPDQTIGIFAISASERLPSFFSTARNAWSARMRVKSLTPPLPSVLPITAMTSSALNCPLRMQVSMPEASCTFFNSTLATSIAITQNPHWSSLLRFPTLEETACGTSPQTNNVGPARRRLSSRMGSFTRQLALATPSPRLRGEGRGEGALPRTLRQRLYPKPLRYSPRLHCSRNGGHGSGALRAIDRVPHRRCFRRAGRHRPRSRAASLDKQNRRHTARSVSDARI